MNILAVDDELLVLKLLTDCIKKAIPDCEVRSFTKPLMALAELQNGFVPQIAFLDVEIAGMNGIELAKRVKDICHKTDIIFVTGFSEYALDAFRVHARGYIMKPISVEKISTELDNLTYHPLVVEPERRLKIQCFGNFEVFSDGVPMKFRYSKTKELFAYLVDRRGSSVTTDELMSILWEDKPDSISLRNQLRNLMSNLTQSLGEAGYGDVLYKRRNFFSVVANELDCEYYKMLAGDTDAINSYCGEYMSQYSWAEMTLGSIESKLGNPLI